MQNLLIQHGQLIDWQIPLQLRTVNHLILVCNKHHIIFYFNDKESNKGVIMLVCYCQCYQCQFICMSIFVMCALKEKHLLFVFMCVCMCVCVCVCGGLLLLLVLLVLVYLYVNFCHVCFKRKAFTICVYVCVHVCVCVEGFWWCGQRKKHSPFHIYSAASWHKPSACFYAAPEIQSNGNFN